MSDNDDLYNYVFDKHSQRGHDGIIEKIMKELSIEKGFFIEFGAWDGIHLSNTRNLYEKGWVGCYIEGDKDKYKDLCNNYKNTDIICLNEYIYPTEKEGKTIDNIYNESISYKYDEIDLLSIDIDGRDYEILENMKIKPKVIIIEGGFSWHPNMKQKIPYDIAKDNLQQPLHVLIECGKNKGYTPICFNQDTFLLRNDLYYRYKYFQDIKNDTYTLWMKGYKNVLTDVDRNWLNQFRKGNYYINKYEKEYFEKNNLIKDNI